MQRRMREISGTRTLSWEGGWPKKLGSGHFVGFLTRSLREGFLSRGAPIKLWRPSVDASALKGSSKKQANFIIRFSAHARVPCKDGVSEKEGAQQVRWERCEGRFPAFLARVLVPLMDSGAISLRGCVCSPPPPATYTGTAAFFDDVGIDLDVYLEPKAVGAPLSDQAIRELFVLMGAVQVRAPSALHMDQNLTARELCEPGSRALFSSEGLFSTALFPSEGHEGCVGADEPPIFKSTLKDYQRAGLSWMRARERARHASQEGWHRLNPLWSEWLLPVHSKLDSGNETATKRIYLKDSEGVIALRPPGACRPVRGGTSVLVADSLVASHRCMRNNEYEHARSTDHIA